MSEILPRHFVQTAEISGVGTGLVRSIFKDLAENASRPLGPQLVNSLTDFLKI
jgi:serine/threonine-protein kinase HipA